MVWRWGWGERDARTGRGARGQGRADRRAENQDREGEAGREQREGGSLEGRDVVLGDAHVMVEDHLVPHRLK